MEIGTASDQSNLMVKHQEATNEITITAPTVGKWRINSNINQNTPKITDRKIIIHWYKQQHYTYLTINQIASLLQYHGRFPFWFNNVVNNNSLWDYNVSSKKEKETTINIKTVTSKFTLLSIKQRQTIVRKFIREVVPKHFNNTKI